MYHYVLIGWLDPEQVEPYTAKRGGPIILLQLENENGRATPTDPYVQYIAALASSLNSSLPFLWCEGGQAEIVPFTAPNSSAQFVPAINGNDGSDYAEAQSNSSPQFPLFWTENEGWCLYPARSLCSEHVSK